MKKFSTIALLTVSMFAPLLSGCITCSDVTEASNDIRELRSAVQVAQNEPSLWPKSCERIRAVMPSLVKYRDMAKVGKEKVCEDSDRSKYECTMAREFLAGMSALTRQTEELCKEVESGSRGESHFVTQPAAAIMETISRQIKPGGDLLIKDRCKKEATFSLLSPAYNLDGRREYNGNSSKKDDLLPGVSTQDEGSANAAI